MQGRRGRAHLPRWLQRLSALQPGGGRSLWISQSIAELLMMTLAWATGALRDESNAMLCMPEGCGRAATQTVEEVRPKLLEDAE
jgi:hypothetical protein